MGVLFLSKDWLEPGSLLRFERCIYLFKPPDNTRVLMRFNIPGITTP